MFTYSKYALLIAAALSLAAPLPEGSTPEVRCTGFPGWNSRFGIGPVVICPTSTQTPVGSILSIHPIMRPTIEPFPPAVEKRNGDSLWKPTYTHGPFETPRPTIRKRDDDDSDEPHCSGIPGWNSKFGHGPVVPCPTKSADGPTVGIPGWKPIYGVGPVVLPKPTTSSA